MVESTIEQLETNDVPDDKLFDTALQLVVVCINRILFLKLLESSLVAFNESDNFKFLNYHKLHSFDDINDLFFAVMAKKTENRLPRIQKEYPNVPYMNSSLFERSDVEASSMGITINQLRQGNIKVYSRTKLKDEHGKNLLVNYLL